jgi:hypothetical protein
MAWPLGPIMGVIPLIELAVCLINIVLILQSPHLHF